MAARRAKLVQHSSFLGLQGNPDACHPRRGSACSVSADRAGGNADPVFALSVQPTAAMSPRFGGSGGEAPDPSFPPFLREEMGAPAGQARPARGHPRRTAGDHRSPLRTARRAAAPHGASSCVGKRADGIRPYGLRTINSTSMLPPQTMPRLAASGERS